MLGNKATLGLAILVSALCFIGPLWLEHDSVGRFGSRRFRMSHRQRIRSALLSPNKRAGWAQHHDGSSNNHQGYHHRGDGDEVLDATELSGRSFEEKAQGTTTKQEGTTTRSTARRCNNSELGVLLLPSLPSRAPALSNLWTAEGRGFLLRLPKGRIEATGKQFEAFHEGTSEGKSLINLLHNIMLLRSYRERHPTPGSNKEPTRVVEVDADIANHGGLLLSGALAQSGWTSVEQIDVLLSSPHETKDVRDDGVEEVPVKECKTDERILRETFEYNSLEFPSAVDSVVPLNHPRECYRSGEGHACLLSAIASVHRCSSSRGEGVGQQNTHSGGDSTAVILCGGEQQRTGGEHSTRPQEAPPTPTVILRDSSAPAYPNHHLLLGSSSGGRREEQIRMQWNGFHSFVVGKLLSNNQDDGHHEQDRPSSSRLAFEHAVVIVPWPPSVAVHSNSQSSIPALIDSLRGTQEREHSNHQRQQQTGKLSIYGSGGYCGSLWPNKKAAAITEERYLELFQRALNEAAESSSLQREGYFCALHLTTVEEGTTRWTSAPTNSWRWDSEVHVGGGGGRFPSDDVLAGRSPRRTPTGSLSPPPLSSTSTATSGGFSFYHVAFVVTIVTALALIRGVLKNCRRGRRHGRVAAGGRRAAE